jgi:hypothetical protein
MDYSTESFVVSPDIATQVRSLLAGKKQALGFSYCVPANCQRAKTCIWCGKDGLFPCTDGNGFDYLAKVSVAANGERHANLVNPHRCPELQRHQEFMNSPTEPEF